jgi:hypothetical protein
MPPEEDEKPELKMSTGTQTITSVAKDRVAHFKAMLEAEGATVTVSVNADGTCDVTAKWGKQIDT